MLQEISKAHQKLKLVTLFIIFFTFNSFQFEADAQVPKIPDWVSKGDAWLKALAQLTRDYNNLKQEINRSTAAYNKNVTVTKGNPNSNNPNPDNIPEKKLTKPKIKDNEFTNLVWEPTNFFDGQLFPSAIISMATYKGELAGITEAISRPIGFNIYSNKSYIPLRYEIECVDKNFFDKITGSYMYTQAGKQVYLDPPIPWNYENLAKQTTSKPVSIYFRLFDEDSNKVEKLVTVQLRSVNDCIYYYKDFNLQFMFSAFVQEEHKEIDNILRDALNTKMATRWVGYQSNEKEVDQQVSAIWRVLHERGFVYSSITANVGDDGKNVHSQAVRTMDNALKTNQANCVDGTVVFASILKKIGINPLMILVPGHCFLGYYTNDSMTSVKFLETTWLSHTYITNNDGKKTEVLVSAKTNDDKNKAYKKLFEAAQSYAMLEYNKYSQDSSVTAIDVNKYRELIKPIPVY